MAVAAVAYVAPLEGAEQHRISDDSIEQPCFFQVGDGRNASAVAWFAHLPRRRDQDIAAARDNGGFDRQPSVRDPEQLRYNGQTAPGPGLQYGERNLAIVKSNPNRTLPRHQPDGRCVIGRPKENAS